MERAPRMGPGSLPVNVESACKPGSVEDSHSSRSRVTAQLKRPTRIQRGPRLWIPIWSCSERGLPSPHTVTSGAVRSYRTISPLPGCPGGILSVALSVGSRLPGVTWRSAQWSPDFPLLHAKATVQPTLPAKYQPLAVCAIPTNLIGAKLRVSAG